MLDQAEVPLRERTVARLVPADESQQAFLVVEAQSVGGNIAYARGFVDRVHRVGFSLENPHDLSYENRADHRRQSGARPQCGWGCRGIRVNTVAPGAIATDFNGGTTRDNPHVNDRIASVTALGRVGESDDIGGVIASLCTDEFGWANAQRIEASGGMVL